METNKKKIFLIGGVVLAVIILLVVILFVKNNTSNNKKQEDPSVSSVIVLQTEDELYQLFNEDGKAINNQKYKDVSEFLNNLAIVENEKEEEGIINSKGKMIVDFGKYKSIYRKGYLFKVTDEEYNDYLLDEKGNVITDLKDIDLIEYFLLDEIIVLESENEYNVLDYTGKSMFKINKNKDEDEIEVYTNERYITLTYNKTTYVVDVLDRKLVTKFDTEEPLCVTSYNTVNTDEYVVSACKGGGLDTYPEFKFMRGEKLVFTENEKRCTNLFFEHNNDNLICAQSLSGRYIVNDKKEMGIEIYLSDIEYIDGKNYITRTSEKSTEFYVNGSKKTEVKCNYPSLSDKTNEIYVLRGTCEDNKDELTYYDINGKKMFDKTFKTATSFNEQKLAIVSEKENEKYLMDMKGNKVSNIYEKLETYGDDHFQAKKSDKIYVLNNKGKEIIETSGSITLKGNYFVVDTPEAEVYYTMTGKKMYQRNYE